MDFDIILVVLSVCRRGSRDWKKRRNEKVWIALFHM